MDKSYNDASSYEAFMRRAYRTNNRHRPGIHMSEMKNLIWLEEGRDAVKHLHSYDKQLSRVKKYLEKALEKTLKFKLNPSERNKIEKAKMILPYVNNSKGLMDIVKIGIQETQRIKDKL